MRSSFSTSVAQQTDNGPIQCSEKFLCEIRDLFAASRWQTGLQPHAAKQAGLGSLQPLDLVDQEEGEEHEDVEHPPVKSAHGDLLVVRESVNFDKEQSR